MEHHVLTQLQYSQDLRGPFALYIYEHNGYHSGAQWFAKAIRYPNEEISISDAKLRAVAAISAGKEVRICDGGDMLVFHSEHGEQLYPKPDVNFWASIGG